LQVRSHAAALPHSPDTKVGVSSKHVQRTATAGKLRIASKAAELPHLSATITVDHGGRTLKTTGFDKEGAFGPIMKLFLI
jgi:hypothetical protein